MEKVEEIKQHLLRGDYTKIGIAAGVTRKYAIMLMDRPTAEKHNVVVEAARKVALFNQGLTK